MFRLHTFLSAETIHLGVVAQDKTDAIRQLVASLQTTLPPENLAEIEAAVLKRERLMSTGVGKGIALPHAKTEAVENMIAAIAIMETPIDFDAIDTQPVQILLLLLSPNDSGMQHVRLLGHVSRLLNRDLFCSRLLNAPDANAVLRIIEEEEMRMSEE